MKPNRLIVLNFFVLACSWIGCAPLDVRRSAIAWNLSRSNDKGSNVRVLRLISEDPETLGRMMACKPSPRPEDLVGEWRGVNKGLGAAAAGLHQDVKVFHRCGQRVEGYNILVEQVKVEELEDCGWQPKRNAFGETLPPMGHFRVGCDPSPKRHQARNHIVLDYSQSGNLPWDPTRHLWDELVEAEPNLLLGRAYMSVGSLRVPIAYFALEKRVSHCDALID
jgi:hypothetical protein